MSQQNVLKIAPSNKINYLNRITYDKAILTFTLLNLQMHQTVQFFRFHIYEHSKVSVHMQKYSQSVLL